MADVYSQRLSGPTQPGTAGPSTLFTVPGGSVYRVVEVQMVNLHASTAQTFVFEVFVGAVWVPWARWTVPANSTLVAPVFLPLIVDEALRCQRTTAGVDGRVTVTGYHLLS